MTNWRPGEKDYCIQGARLFANFVAPAVFVSVTQRKSAGGTLAL
jgi:hypothetical protein